MISKIKGAMKDELVRGSIVLLIGIVIFNFLNYAFQISMAKMLGPADFGILAALMSIVYIMTIPVEAIQTVVSKYTSKFVAQGKKGKINELMIKSGRRGLFLATICFVILLVLSILFAKTIGIKVGLLIFTAIFAFYMFTIPILRGILQGEKKFSELGISLFVEAFVKLIFSIILVYIGWNVYGAIGGLLVGGIASYIVTLSMLKDIRKSKREKEEFEGLYKGSFLIVLVISAIVLMLSIDILIAKAVFDAETAGQYAFVSLIGKVIIFLSMAIGKAMLPMSSENHERGRETSKLFKKSLLLVSGLSLIALIFYYFIPEFLVWLISLGSKEYLPASGILFTLGLGYTFLSLANVIALYGVSTNKINKLNTACLLFCVLIQIGLLYSFHSSLESFANAFLWSNIIIFGVSVVVIAGKK